MGRTSPDERREHIIDVASQVFQSEGYGAASMATIAARLGGSKATLYKYFPSKEALFAAMLAHKCERVIAPLRVIGIEANDFESYLAAFARGFLSSLLQIDALKVFQMIQADGGRFPEISRQFMATGPEAGYRELAKGIEKFVARGDIVCDDPRLAAEQFLGAVRADIHLRATIGIGAPPDEAEIARQSAHAARIFAKGLAAAHS
ncbi:TetR/AcrR family transcriptional regulator [Novosphingobium huizhouense]|uniref:TetR/AcrR family transcriptional regulator n=1 Tax=Novosphingobium huizhouense TaxID=2866625 RepID=UPI001CD856B0|nr:TetR/AcrR family transcriptional regulator [Novosphingobium huizhouense]